MIEDRIDLVFSQSDEGPVSKPPEQDAELNQSELSVQVRTLKLLLEEQQRATIEMARQATLESIRATREHQKELEKTKAEAEEARAEAEKIKQQAAQAAHRAATEVRRVEAEFSNSRRWNPSSQATPRAAQSRRTDVDSSNQTEGQDALGSTKKPKASAFRGPKFILQIVALSLMCAAIAMLSISSISKPPNTTTVSAPVEKETPFAQAIERSSIAEGLEPENTKRGASFVRSTDRLGRAFESFPELQPSQIVHEVNRTHPGDQLACPMEWNAAGEPAFILGGGHKIPESLISTIDECASLVEQYRLQRLKSSR